MADANDLVTLARAKQVPALSVIGNTYLATLITAASGFICNYCSREFISVERTELLDGDGEDEVLLTNTPITAIGAVVVTDQWAGDSETYSSSDFITNLKTGLLKFSPTLTSGTVKYFTPGVQNVSVTYTAGYATIPETVQQACCDIIKAMYAQGSSTNNPALMSEKMGEYSWTAGRVNTSLADLNSILPASARAALAPYRRAMTTG